MTAFRVEFSRAARRSIAERLPEPVAAAALDLAAGPLTSNPHCVGKPLGGELAGLFSARLGTYRAVYEIDEAAGVVRVVRVEHRRDAYRT